MGSANSFGERNKQGNRALSFRYYGLSGAVPIAYAESGLIALEGTMQTK